MLQSFKSYHFIVVIGPGPYGGEATTYSKETGLNITALEINKKYIESGKKTAQLNNVNVKFIHSDLFTPFSPKDRLPSKIDCFAWNPPYLDSETVKKYNLSKSASDGGPTGKELMERSLNEFKQLPSKHRKTKLAFCINTKRHKSRVIEQLIEQQGYKLVKVFKVESSPCKVFVMKLSV